MADLSVIDRFTETFSHYIDSGFGLLSGDVSFLSSTLVGIDLTLAGLAWSLKADDQILVTLAKKVIYVGAFAFIISNFKGLADIVFASFSSIGLKASGGTLTAADLARPGFVASAGFTAAHPLLEETGQFSGLDVLTNLPTILIVLFCWILIVLAFFVLSVQLFVTLIEFKLTTLASFILVPFALWGKTAFLAEKTLGNVVASGVKVMVLAIIIGIGSTIFGQLAGTLTHPIDIASAMSLLLAALSLFGLGILGPGIAAGLVSGAPQLGAGAAAGTVAGAAAVAIGGGAAAWGGLRAAASGSMAAVRSAASLAGASSGSTSAQAQAAGKVPSSMAGSSATGAASPRAARAPSPPSRRHVSEAAKMAAHTLKEGDRGGHSMSPKLEED